jgi:hypothetical protein
VAKSRAPIAGVPDANAIAQGAVLGLSESVCGILSIKSQVFIGALTRITALDGSSKRTSLTKLWDSVGVLVRACPEGYKSSMKSVQGVLRST